MLSDYKSEDLEDETIYGLVKNIDEARAYNLTFDPYLYTPEAAERYRQFTYHENECEQEANEDKHDENIIGLWESDEDSTEQNKEDTHMDTDNAETQPKSSPHETKPASTAKEPQPSSHKTTPN